MMYGRSARKALDTFDLDHNKWPELAANRLAWRAMLRSRGPPPDYRAPPPTPAAPSRSHGSSDGRRRRAVVGRRLPAPELAVMRGNSIGVDLFLHAEPRRCSELLHGVLDRCNCNDAARREEKDLPQLNSSSFRAQPQPKPSLLFLPRACTLNTVLACKPYLHMWCFVLGIW